MMTMMMMMMMMMMMLMMNGKDVRGRVRGLI
jgi:hypothetical protein